jgi:hypothetical protein
MGPSRVPTEPADGKSNDVARWLVVAGWSTGLAGLYVLLSLAHAAVVERALTVDVAFGRSLAYWVGATYLALLAWGFLPRHSSRWFARRRPTFAALAVGLLGGAVSVGYTALWLARHWVPAIAVPVAGAIVVLVVAAVVVLRLAARDDQRAAERP